MFVYVLVFLVSRHFLGSLLKRAREKVSDDGYVFAKGRSRAHGSQSDSDDVPKRKRMDADERAREMKVLQENIATLESRIQFKNQMLNKARSVTNYKLCDEISGDIINIRKDKRAAENRLAAMKKKQSKSQWYHSKKPKKSEGEDDSREKEGTSTILDHFDKSSNAKPDETSILSRSNSSSSVASDESLILLSDEPANANSMGEVQSQSF